jgi:5-(carboxyamino)imidazole ribonucleotide mutase
MPSGVPVATVAIGGGRNAGLLAVEMLSIGMPELLPRLLAYKEKIATDSRAKNENL